MIDTLLANLARARSRPTLTTLGVEPNEYGLVTLHRPANVDSPAMLEQLLLALARVAAELPLVFPAHPRVASQLAARAPIDGLRVVEPMGYLDFVALESQALVVLTDSGGVQEETTALGIPCLTLRRTPNDRSRSRWERTGSWAAIRRGSPTVSQPHSTAGSGGSSRRCGTAERPSGSSTRSCARTEVLTRPSDVGHGGWHPGAPSATLRSRSSPAGSRHLAGAIGAQAFPGLTTGPDKAADFPGRPLCGPWWRW
jgi:hypothetical protein